MALTSWRRLPALDGLRTLAVLPHHADPQDVPGGYIGVDAFFVISGFVITRLLLDEQVRTGGLRLRRFYADRLWGVAPALVTMVALVCLVLPFTDHARDLITALTTLVYTTDLAQVLSPSTDQVFLHTGPLPSRSSSTSPGSCWCCWRAVDGARSVGC